MDRDNDKNDRPPPTRETKTVPVVEERVDIERREVDGKTVTVSVRPVSEDMEVAEPVRREDVTIERVPVNKVVTERPEIREDGDLTIIPVVEERVRVVRELVLTEEIHMRRTSTSDTHRETVTLRRTEVDIDEKT